MVKQLLIPLLLACSACEPGGDSSQLSAASGHKTPTGESPVIDAAVTGADTGGPVSSPAWSTRRYVLDVQGHRGNTGNVPPGNTLPSFESALTLGVDTIEADMHITADNQVVFAHDRRIATEECSWAGSDPEPDTNINNLTLAQISQWDCHPELSGIQSPPSLAEGLSLDDTIPWNVELKEISEAAADTYLGALIDFNTQCGGCLAERVTLQSFTWARLEYAKQTYFDRPEYGNFKFRVSLLGVVKQDAAVSAASSYADIWSPRSAIVTQATVDYIHGLGMQVIPWTVNDPIEMQSLIDLGVDGIITDYPDLLLALVRE